MRPSDASDLTEILTTLKDGTDDREAKVSLGEVLGAFGSRSFGPLLLVPALITVLPTGAVPGVPSLMGIVVALIAVQLLIGRTHPWLPQRLTSVEIERERLVDTVEAAQPYTERVDRFLRPRFVWLTDAPFPQIIAAICIVMAVSMVPLELIPFGVAVPGFAVGLMALGLVARDGVLVVSGIVFAVGAISLVTYAASAVAS